jgi:toxin secretion/phage lysis holin
MRDIVNGMQCAFAALGGAIGAVMGGFDGFLYALLLFVIVDYVTGVMVAVVQKTLSSEVGFVGIAKKVAIFCLVAVAHVIDFRIIQTGSVIRTAVIFFYLSNEGISITENAAALGLPIPKKLRRVLEQLKEEDDKDDQ